MITGRTKLYGIFGYPVEHTFSPGMHNAAFQKLHMNACYVPFAVHPDKLAEAAHSIIPLGLSGINVTVPHKEKIISFLDELSEEARLIGAVNTIEIREGRLIGHNTDGRGFLRSLRDNAGFKPKGRRFLIAGSGGAARAVGFSLALAGAKKIVFADIEEAKAENLAGTIRDKLGTMAEALPVARMAAYAPEADCLINATPLGMKKNDPLSIHPDCIHKKQLVCDLVYNQRETRLLAAARRRGASGLPGIGMLLFQGVIAFEIWTGKKAPVPVMKTALSGQIAGLNRGPRK